MRRPVMVLAALGLLLGAACGGEQSGNDNEATGIVVDVQGDLQDVDRFSVLVDGERMDFETSPDGDYAFPVGHLRDHLRSGEPVRVRWEEEGDRRIATFVDDA